ANINGDGETILSSNVKEGRLAPAHRFAGRAFVDHFLIDQFLHQDADGSARDVHAPRQVRPRDGLMLADKIKRDASINIARCAACGDAEILGIDLAHSALSFVRSCDNILSADFLSTVFLEVFLGSTRRAWRPALGTQSSRLLRLQHEPVHKQSGRLRTQGRSLPLAVLTRTRSYSHF